MREREGGRKGWTEVGIKGRRELEGREGGWKVMCLHVYTHGVWHRLGVKI